MANLNGKYKISCGLEYEVKNSETEFIMTLPVRQIKKRTKQLMKLTRYLVKLKLQGWDIENIEVLLDDETIGRIT